MINKGEVIVVEGLWSSGKTTMVNHLVDRYGIISFPEPDHLKTKEQINDNEEWYWREFMKIEKKVLDLKNDGEKIVLDRCRISVLSYLYALQENEKLNRFIKRVPIIDKFDVIILINQPVNVIAKRITNPEDMKYSKTRVLADNVDFVLRYDYFMKKAVVAAGKRIIKIKDIKNLDNI